MLKDKQAVSALHTLGQYFHPSMIPQSVRTWSGDKTLERRLKNRKKARLLCPVCNPAVAVECPL